ncbi:MAG: preprotein translocase subunit SecE [Propionibacteriaceae bacterium]|nr:preprotein translocase subunit SecE [Propionibacteriaceae bacterium]
MSDDKTQQDGEERPEADPVADDEVIADLEEQFDEEASADDADAAEKKPASKVVARKTAKAPVKKTTKTRKRSETVREEHDPYRAKNPAQFVRQSAGELKKVVWPTWPELTTLYAAVLIFVLFIILYVGLLDAGFGWALLKLFGGTP